MNISGDGHPTRAPLVFGVTLAMIVISTIFVFLRFVSRIGIVRRVTLDDYFMLLAWIIAFGVSFAICWGSAVGLGRHITDVPDHWIPPLKKSWYTFSVLYNPALMATKTSILVFFLTLAGNQKIFKWATVITLVVVNGAGIALTFLNIFQCRPVDAAWANPAPASAMCTSVITLYLSSAPVNIITDCAILLLPMPILTMMRLPRKQKIILVITFGFGIFVTAIDVVRIAYLQEASAMRLQDVQQGGSSTATTIRGGTDFSWYGSLSFMWSVIEVNVGIWCACVPALKPLVSKFLPNLIRDTKDVPEKLQNFHTIRSPTYIDEAAEQNVPSVPDTALRQYESAEPTEKHEEQSMGILDFLTTPDGGAVPSYQRTQTMGMMDFLTTPDMEGLPVTKRTQTAMRNTSRNTRPASPTFFDFVNMKKKKSMVHMTNKESLFPIAMVSVLFFLWGFAYGLLDTLNAQFQAIAHMTQGQSTGIHSAYFAGYLISPLTFGRLLLRHLGFKACYIVGLVIYACGTLIFWPSAVLTSFPAFLVSNFIVGVGLSTLEIAANPFITLCGPPEYGEIRLNLSQAIQAIGSIVSPLVARKALFSGTVLNAPSLIDVQWTYLGIALFCILLAVLYHYLPLPEATDEELEEAAERMDNVNQAKLGTIRIIWITLGLGVFSQFMYVGGQEAVSVYFGNYMIYLNTGLSTVSHQAIGHTAFAVGRFLAAGLGFFIKPRHLLVFFYLGAVVFSALSMYFAGSAPAAFIIVLYLFEGPIFCLIYAISLRGLGRHTKDAAAYLTAAISGGALFAGVIHIVGQETNPQYAMVVAVAPFAAGAIFAIYLETVPKAMRQVEPLRRNKESPLSASTSSSRSTKRMLGALHWRRKETATALV